MKTKKQKELIDSLLSTVDDDVIPLYRDIILYLSELGYNPHKQRSYIVFKHDLHNKQMAKTGKRINKALDVFFALRFSACRGYSQRFAEIVKEAVDVTPPNEVGCINNRCNFCQGEAGTHVYTYTFPNEETKYHCGAVALEIPEITMDDIAEIKKLIKEQHEYLLKHEAGILA